jgi:hypothetical protein
MVTSQKSFRRLVVAGALTLATLGVPAALAAGVTGSSLADCTSGEEMDVFTTNCTPFLVPNSPSGFTTNAANPDVPEIDGVPCTGADSGACIGLSEDQAAAGPQPVPHSTISSSP